MTWALYATASKVMIWDRNLADTDTIDNTILNNPDQYLARIKFHSDFSYLKLVGYGVTTTVINIPAQSAVIGATTRDWSVVTLGAGQFFMPVDTITNRVGVANKSLYWHSTQDGFFTRYAMRSVLLLKEGNNIILREKYQRDVNSAYNIPAHTVTLKYQIVEIV